VCTLFEKDYHHGVAALVNSLLRSGFEGRVYAGYRGPLPAWAQDAQPAQIGSWRDAPLLGISATCDLAFLPLQTQAHFTNIKPDFMLQVLSEASPPAEGVLYLDPDICVAETWQFLLDWMSCGVALCEDVNSPLGRDHPRRVGWRRHFGVDGVALEFRTDAYVNGGCVGVLRSDLGFLENWRRLTLYMAQIIGGLGASQLEGGGELRQAGMARCFDRSDQDALNAAIEATGGLSYSILPRAAMGFCPGVAVVPHALGTRKPWRRSYLLEALSGFAPTTADKAFWRNVDGPLFSMSRAAIWRARSALSVASGAARIYRRY
jgi:hypothetical protein